MARLRRPEQPADDDSDVPERLRRFRREDWPEGTGPRCPEMQFWDAWSEYRSLTGHEFPDDMPDIPWDDSFI